MNNLIESTSKITVLFTYISIQEQIQNVYDDFLALTEHEPVTNTNYLEAQDLLPLFNSREVLFAS